MNFQQMYNALFDKKWRVKNYRKAFPLLISAAQDGYPHAQNLVGYAFDLGLAPARNAKKAVYWYKRAANSGHPESLYNLALVADQPMHKEMNVFKASGELRAKENVVLPLVDSSIVRMVVTAEVGC